MSAQVCSNHNCIRFNRKRKGKWLHPASFLQSFRSDSNTHKRTYQRKPQQCGLSSQASMSLFQTPCQGCFFSRGALFFGTWSEWEALLHCTKAKDIFLELLHSKGLKLCLCFPLHLPLKGCCTILSNSLCPL